MDFIVDIDISNLCYGHLIFLQSFHSISNQRHKNVSENDEARQVRE